MTGRFKAFRKNLLLAIGSTVFAAIFAEVVLRIVLPAPIVWKYPQENYRYDSEIGHWLEPNQFAYTHDKVVSTNSMGIRDSEYALEAPLEVYRILALGDSQTFGNGLELTDTWPKQLEANLNQAGVGMRVEVLNCGLPGSDTWQHEVILERMLARYQPDVVVLAFYVNDVVKRFTPSPVQHEVDNDAVVRIGYMMKRSALLLTLRTAWGSAKQMWSPNKGFLLQQALLKGEDNSVLEERWEQVDNSLSAMKKASDEQNVDLLIASLPRRDQIEGKIPWEAYNQRLMKITGHYQIPLISMLESLQQSYKEHGKALFIPWDGHNSKIANHIIAQKIAGQILATRQSR